MMSRTLSRRLERLEQSMKPTIVRRVWEVVILHPDGGTKKSGKSYGRRHSPAFSRRNHISNLLPIMTDNVHRVSNLHLVRDIDKIYGSLADVIFAGSKNPRGMRDLRRASPHRCSPNTDRLFRVENQPALVHIDKTLAVEPRPHHSNGRMTLSQ